MKKRFILMIFVIFLIFSTSCFIITAEDEKNIQITSMNIEVEINNGYTVTEVSAEINNPYNEDLNGTFSILLPDNAFVSNFSLTLDYEIYYAQVLEKGEAEKKFSEAKTQKKTAGMVETRDMKQFSYSINLKPYQTVNITLRYEEFLEKQLGERVYTFALSSIYDQPISKLLLLVKLNSEREIISLEKIGCSEQTTIEWIDTKHGILSIKETDFLPSEDFSFKYSESALPVNGSVVTYYDEDNDQYYFFHIFSPQKDDLGGSIPKDIIFVLDKSGSMTGNKISQLKDAFSEIILSLPSEDKFTIIMFDTDYKTYSPKLLVANNDNINSAINYIKSIGASGSTNLYDGLEFSLDILKYSKGRSPIIILLTDGLPNCGKYETPPSIRENIMERNHIQCPIFTLGFGSDVDFDFLTALSLENYANSKKIYLENDASEQIQNYYDTISTVLLRDISVDYYPSCEYVYPTSIPSLFEGSETVISGICPNASKLSSEIIARARNGDLYFNSTFDLNKSQVDNIFIYRYWAYSRINFLLDMITIQGEKSTLISEIVNLSIEGNFVTPYTSLYLEIEDQPTGKNMFEEVSIKEDNNYNYRSGPRNDYESPGFELLIFILAIFLVSLCIKLRKK
jgi:uncharacterized protein YegL